MRRGPDASRRPMTLVALMQGAPIQRREGGLAADLPDPLGFWQVAPVPRSQVRSWDRRCPSANLPAPRPKSRRHRSLQTAGLGRPGSRRQLTLLLWSLPPEPIIVKPEDRRSYAEKETAARLNLSSPQVYQTILAGELHCYRAGRTIRIPLEETERREGTTRSHE